MAKKKKSAEPAYTDPSAQSMASPADLAVARPDGVGMSGGPQQSLRGHGNAAAQEAMQASKRPSRRRPMIHSANGVEIPQDLQESEKLAHHFAYMDPAVDAEGAGTGRLRRCDAGEADGKCVTPQDEQWLTEHDFEDQVFGDAATDFQAVKFNTGARQQQSHPGMKNPQLSVRGTHSNRDWLNNFEQGGVSQEKYAANYPAMWSAIDELAADTGQKVNLSGHSQAAATVGQLAADHGAKVNEVHTFQGAGTPKAAMDRFTRKHGPGGSANEIPVYNTAAQTDIVDRVGNALPGRNVTVSNDASGRLGAPELGMTGPDDSLNGAMELVGLGGGVALGHPDKNLLTDFDRKVAKEDVTHRSLRDDSYERSRDAVGGGIAAGKTAWQYVTDSDGYLGSHGAGEHRMHDAGDVQASALDADLKGSAHDAPDSADLLHTDEGRRYVEQGDAVTRRAEHNLKGSAHDAPDSADLLHTDEGRRYVEQGDAVTRRAEHKEM
ncbi:MAG: hypothetical protein ACI8RZ_005125, partial [Myxococcota bacterium]